MMVVTYQTCGLQTVNHLILTGQLPIEGNSILLMVPPTVKPDRTDFAILSEKFGQLCIHKLVIVVPICCSQSLTTIGTCATYGIIIAHPVDMAVVQVQADTLFLTCLCQFFQYVTTKGSSLHDIELALLGSPHRETIVMTGGEADILGTSLLDATHPLSCIKTVRIESICHLGIFITVGHCILQIPLALSKHAIQAPVQENTQLHISEFLTRLQISLGGNILCLRLHT